MNQTTDLLSETHGDIGSKPAPAGADALRLDPSELALLKLCGYESIFEGCGLAIEEVTACVAASHETYGLARLGDWALRSKRFAVRLKDLERDGRPWIGLPSSKATDPNAGDLMSNLRDITLSPDALHRARALMGVRMTRHLPTEKALPLEIVEAHLSLLLCQALRSRRHEDWRVVSEHEDLTEKGLLELRGKLKSAVVRDVVDDVLVTLATAAIAAPDESTLPRVAPTPDAVAEGTDVDTDDDPDGIYGDQPPDQESAATGANPSSLRENPATAESAARANEANSTTKFSLLGWRIVDALHAPLTRKLGVGTDWGALPRLDLVALCARLKQAFLSGDTQTRDFVFLAYHSQQWSLPPQLALTVPTERTAPLHYDVEAGRRVWPYGDLIDKDPADGADPANSIMCTRIAIDCDPDIADHGRAHFGANPGAKNIGELIGAGRSGEEVRRFLKRYRKFLRSFSSAVHPPYAGRFSRSYGPLVKDITGSDVLSVFLATDTSMSAGGMPHYVTMAASFLASWNRIVHAKVGWRAPDEAADGQVDVVGAGIGLPFERYLNGWVGLQAETAEALAELSAANSLAAISVAWTKLARARLLSLGCLSGHRLTRIARLTAEALFGHSQYICLSDKVTTKYDAYRLIPVTARVAQLLVGLLSDFGQLQAAIQRVDPEAGGLTDVSVAQSKAVFFGLKCVVRSGRLRLKREALLVSSLDDLSQRHFARDKNVGRHTLVSWLVQTNIDPWLIRALTGHGTGLAEVFGDATAVAPRRLLAELKTTLDRCFENDGFEPYRTAGSLPPRIEFARRRAVPLAAGDPYVYPQLESDGHILPAPADRYTTVSLTVVDAIRSLLLVPPEDVDAHDPWVHWLLAGIAFDGLHHGDLQEIHEQLPGSLVRLGSTILAAWIRDGRNNLFAVPLLPPTLAALSLCDLDARPNWSVLLAKAGSRLQSAMPEIAWPQDPADALLSFVAMAGRWQRVHVSPAVLAASLRCVMSSTFSAHSLLRLADENPPGLAVDTLAQWKALRPSKTRRASRKERPAIDGIGTVLFRYQDTAGKRHGENEARSYKVLDDLVGHDTSGDLPALAALMVVRKEMALIKEEDKHCRDIGGLATYWTEVALALKLVPPSENLRAWTAPDFAEWAEQATVAIQLDARMKGKRGPLELDGLRRFLRTARLLGWEVPYGLFEGRDIYAQDGVRQSAASTLVRAADFEVARPLVAHALRDLPLAQRRADLRLDLDKEVPGRSGELNTLLSRCVTSASHALCIRPAGHSAMKNAHAPRLVGLSDGLADRMLDFAGEDIDAFAEFLFLDDGGNDWSMLEMFRDVIHQAFLRITGDINFRFHAIRGSAACRLAYPQWEAWTRSLLQGTTGVDHAGKPIGVPRDAVAKALAALGHARTISFLGYYLPIWLWLKAHELRLRLQDELPPITYEHMLFGGSSASRRKAEERAKKRHEAFDRWDWIGRQVASRIEAEPLRDDRPPLVIAPEIPERPELPALLALTRYGVMRLVEMPLAVAAHRSGVNATFAGAMEDELDALAPSIEAVWERRGQFRGKRGKATDARLALGKVGNTFAEHFARLSAQQLTLLKTCLDANRGEMLLLPNSNAALEGRIRELANCMPRRTAKMLVRSPLGSDFVPAPGLVVDLKEAVTFGDPERDVGKHPLYQVEPADSLESEDDAPVEKDKRKRTGPFTGLARATSIAALAAHKVLSGVAP